MSASVTARSAAGNINVHEAGDYPIILGESLKDNSRSKAKYLQLRYNWAPQDGFQCERGALTSSPGGIGLSYQDAEQQREYNYSGFPAVDPEAKDAKDSSRLILVFDETRSAFVLEQVSTSVDLNVKSATGHSAATLQRKRQLRHASSTESSNGKNGGKESDDEDDVADPSNPFDFRHFLAEAREAAEKATQSAESRTPMTTVASPSINNARFNSTPAFRPPAVTTTTLPKKPTADSKPLRQATSSSTKKAVTNKRKEPATSKPSAQQPLSKERITDSDEELSDNATTTARMGKPHTRNASLASNVSRSPPTTYSGGLEIIMDEPEEPRRRHKLDRDAFRSHTHTPTFGHSSNRATVQRYAEDDVEMKETAHSEAEDEDDDVEDFVLPSPHSRKGEEDAPPPDEVSTPGNGDQDEDDDEEAMLAEALEAALDDDDDNNNNSNNAGTGGQSGWGHGDDDESEISEEE